METLGSIIKNFRDTNNLSLREFSKKCNLSHTYIDKLEKGVDPRSGKPVEPTLDVLEKISSAINISLDDLLTKLGKINSKKGNMISINKNDNDNDIEKIIDELMEQKGLMLCGEPMSEEDMFLLRNSIRSTIELAKTMKGNKK